MAEPKVTVEVPSFTVAQLRVHSQVIFGVDPLIFDGALSTQTKPLTVVEARDIINEWLMKEVK